MNRTIAVNEVKLLKMLETVWDETTMCPHVEDGNCETMLEQCLLWEKDGSCIECWLRYLTK